MLICKYALEAAITQEIEMPMGATILSVANQNDEICIWAMVDPSLEKETRTIAVIGTGQPVPQSLTFIGTVLMGSFVWHIFER